VAKTCDREEERGTKGNATLPLVVSWFGALRFEKGLRNWIGFYNSLPFESICHHRMGTNIIS